MKTIESLHQGYTDAVLAAQALEAEQDWTFPEPQLKGMAYFGAVHVPAWTEVERYVAPRNRLMRGIYGDWIEVREEQVFYLPIEEHPAYTSLLIPEQALDSLFDLEDF